MKNILAIIIIMTSSTLSGLHLSKNLISRAAELEKMQVFIAYCKMQISYMAQNLELIINAYIEEHKQNLPVFILENFKETSNESAQAKIIKTLNTFKVKNSLNDGDIKCFKAFISGLGKGDIDSQIALCKLYENLISERLSLAKKDSEKYASLYTALSVLAGMALSILLI